MQSQIAQRAPTSEAPPKLKITFKQEAIDDIADLLNMVVGRILKMSLLDFVVLVNVAEFRQWEHDDNRTVVISFNNNFDKEFVINRMRNAFENIEVVNN